MWVSDQVDLDTADNAFDDQYMGCAEEMEEMAHQLLKELEANKEFSVEWKWASETWNDIKNTMFQRNSMIYMEQLY